VRHDRREKTREQQSHVSLSARETAEPSTMPFAQRLTCTIDDACEATGLGRTKLYELIGAGRIVTTTIGRRRLVVVRSLLALLDTNISN
jgi:excisionase family DNA binding protein